ncbi:MAG: hypothetical protein PHG59_02715 [Patescibacteria group bacterium]|nr:hypothetical protein [Patescibacteria group bacterium]
MITNEQIINQINKAIFEQKTLLYVTRQKERAQGLEDVLTHYKIISQNKDSAEIIEKTKLPKGLIIVFKNNTKIQRICQEKKLKLLNPDYSLNEKYENKISQYQWLKTIIPQNLPKTIITLPIKSSFQNLKKEINAPFICQFNRSHTGEGTFLISRQAQWQKMAKKFPFREVKCVKFIKSPIITVNVCLWPSCIKNSADKQGCVLVGNPSYQITGLKELTDFKFSTVGNDWSWTKKNLSSNDLKAIKNLSETIGQNMIKEGWRGLFGLDLVKDKKWLIIEINARQPASAGWETLLQRDQGEGITVLASHFAALLNLPLPASCSEMQKSLQKIQKGSRIIIRRKNAQNYTKLKKMLQNPLPKPVIEGAFRGSDPKINVELFQIRSLENGLVKKNGQLNKTAKLWKKKF